MEEKFLAAVEAARQKALSFGVRVRPVPDLPAARRILSGHRESDGFYQLVALGHAELTLEALAVQKAFTGLFTDQEANNALTRLMDAGYTFR
jgi:hypothetical protein